MKYGKNFPDSLFALETMTYTLQNLNPLELYTPIQIPQFITQQFKLKRDNLIINTHLYTILTGGGKTSAFYDRDRQMTRPLALS